MIKFNLRDHMKKNNLTTADLVKMTGIHRNTISKLLNGNSKGIQFETLDSLCIALGLDSAADLIEFIKDDHVG